jgi:hypothetical protein
MDVQCFWLSASSLPASSSRGGRGPSGRRTKWRAGEVVQRMRPEPRRSDLRPSGDIRRATPSLDEAVGGGVLRRGGVGLRGHIPGLLRRLGQARHPVRRQSEWYSKSFFSSFSASFVRLPVKPVRLFRSDRHSSCALVALIFRHFRGPKNGVLTPFEAKLRVFSTFISRMHLWCP